MKCSDSCVWIFLLVSAFPFSLFHSVNPLSFSVLFSFSSLQRLSPFPFTSISRLFSFSFPLPFLYNLLSDSISQVNMKLGRGRPITLIWPSPRSAQETLDVGSCRVMDQRGGPRCRALCLWKSWGSAWGCGAYSNTARCCRDSQGLGLHMVMRGGGWGGGRRRGEGRRGWG